MTTDLQNSPQFRHNVKTEKWQDELLKEQHSDIRETGFSFFTLVGMKRFSSMTKSSQTKTFSV